MIESDLDKLFAEKAAYQRAQKIALIAVYPICYFPIAMMVVIYLLMRYVDCSWWLPVALLLVSIAPFPLLQVLHTNRCKRSVQYIDHRNQYLERIPLGIRNERYSAARSLYGDDWDTALIECEEAHVGGDCPLCGAA